MENFYTDNKNQQLLQALLKKHGIRKVIASPGGTNPTMVMSLQMDDFFEMYSCVDERSAAYMACGMAVESGEPVILCCTGATASRNYMPALTEAYYRKIPLVVITCSRPNYYVGHLMPQVTNRNVYPADILVDGEHLQAIDTKNDRWDCEFKINKALLELKRHGGGPVHFNVETTLSSCSTVSLPNVHAIYRITPNDKFPEMGTGKIGIFLGSHAPMSEQLTNLIDKFCFIHNAVVFCDHTSGYYGKYAIQYALIGTQLKHKFDLCDLDLLIHMGEPSGDYLTMNALTAKHVWRLNEDGEIRIRFKTLDYVFEMTDYEFFSYYTKDETFARSDSFWKECKAIYDTLYNSIPDLPLCHIYIAQKLSKQMPANCVMHFSIINALRSWNFFKLDRSIRTYCNVGGFGIDGCTSSTIGASLVHKDKLYYLFTGDLAFFYDLNALGNRHICNNLRIMLINDGKGAEFVHFMSPKYQGDRNLFIAGGGHFGSQSKFLVKNYAENLGFEYMQATTTEEFDEQYTKFISPQLTSKPVLFEIITSTDNQSFAWETLSNIASANTLDVARSVARQNKKVLSKILKGLKNKL